MASDAASIPETWKGLRPCPSGFKRNVSSQAVTFPDVGKEVEVEVGGTLLGTMRATIATTGIRLPADTTFAGRRAGSGYTITVPAGDYDDAVLTRIGFFAAPAASFKYDREARARHGLGAPDVELYVDPTNSSVLKAHVMFGLSSQDVTNETARFDQPLCLDVSSKGFRREVLYSGAAKGVLSLQYREFMNDFARPAFSQELTFDLADGNEIGFRGARFRVIKISNVGLRYVVDKPIDGQ